LVLTGLASLMVISVAFGQQGGDTVDRQKCLPSEHLESDAGRSAGKNRGEQDKTLTEQLAPSDGVICPPDIGPDIRLKPPATGSMPVIPPPDTRQGTPERP